MEISGLLMVAMIPSQTSIILWGGMLVAIPTAIPDEPLTRRFGNLEGKTSGSCNELSKLSLKATVFFSISLSISSADLLSLASVYLIAAAESPSIEPKLP